MDSSVIMSKDEAVPPKFTSLELVSPAVTSNKSVQSMVSSLGSHDSFISRQSLDLASTPPAVQRQSSMQTVFTGGWAARSPKEKLPKQPESPPNARCCVCGVCCCCKGFFY